MIDQKRIDLLINEIELRKEGAESLAATYRDAPALKEILSILKEKGGDEAEEAFRFETLVYVAEQYESLGRFSVAANVRLLTLKSADILKNEYEDEVEGLNDAVSLLLRDRNFYVDDDCEDVAPLINRLLPEEAAKKCFDRIKARRRSLKHDPVEMSPEYLAVIDEVEEKIEKNRTMRGMGSCHEIWALKGEYLAEKGIAWRSPAMLNPRVMFD